MNISHLLVKEEFYNDAIIFLFVTDPVYLYHFFQKLSNRQNVMV